MTTTQIFPTPFFQLKDFLNSFGTESVQNKNVPVSSINEKENGYEVEVELPGVRKENIEIRIEKNLLSISATRKKGGMEFSYKRDFKISDEIDSNEIKASFENGLLVLELTKKKESEAKKIEIL